jgi:hypothetical protein
MKEETEAKLVKDFPQIFRDWGGNPMETCMAWGLEVGEGWSQLLRKLCEDIMATNPPENFKAAQVKEKFGGLRFYFDGGTEKISKLIHKAENESYKTCEACGSKENVASEGAWIVTLCDKCRRKPSCT